VGATDGSGALSDGVGAEAGSEGVTGGGVTLGRTAGVLAGAAAGGSDGAGLAPPVNGRLQPATESTSSAARAAEVDVRMENSLIRALLVRVADH
jgi:hypothetical protein